MMINTGAFNTNRPRYFKIALRSLIDIAQIEFPMLRTQVDFDHGEAPEAIKQVQYIIPYVTYYINSKVILI